MFLVTYHYHLEIRKHIGFYRHFMPHAKCLFVSQIFNLETDLEEWLPSVASTLEKRRVSSRISLSLKSHYCSLKSLRATCQAITIPHTSRSLIDSGERLQSVAWSLGKRWLFHTLLDLWLIRGSGSLCQVLHDHWEKSCFWSHIIMFKK